MDTAMQRERLTEILTELRYLEAPLEEIISRAEEVYRYD